MARPQDALWNYNRKGGWYGWKPLIELTFLYSSFIEIGQTAPCRAIRGDSISVNSTLPPPIQVPPRADAAGDADGAASASGGEDDDSLGTFYHIFPKSNFHTPPPLGGGGV